MNEATDQIPVFTEKDKARFWSKVAKKSDSECWEWQGAIAGSGYGRSWIQSTRKQIDTHRASWIIHFGLIPKDGTYHGSCVCHRCDNRKCCNPHHLFLGSMKDNIRDMIGKGRRAKPAGRGINNGSAKLTELQVVEIRQRRINGEKLQAIADRFGVSNSAIYNICARKKWAHVQ
jgi:hypothetical protein